MNKKNFFDFNFENLKHFLKQELNIDNKKVSMRSNQIMAARISKRSFRYKKFNNSSFRVKRKNLIVL